MKTFQKPLTAAEERLCLRRCQEGDPEAKRILIERNLRLVAHVAKKYQNSGEDLEDLISVAAEQNFVPVIDDKGDFIGIVTRSRILRYYLQTNFPHE